MATYIVLGKYMQGMTKVEERSRRRAAARELAESFGARIEQVYMTLGHYDLVLLVDAPDEETIAKLAMHIHMQGNLSTETLRAFDEKEAERLL